MASATPFLRSASGISLSSWASVSFAGAQALRGGAADIGVAADRVLGDAVAVEQRRAVDQHRARFALLAALLEPFQARGLVAVLEQQQAERRLGIEMALVGGALEPGLRGGQVGRDAAAEAIGLAEVELGIGVAVLGERAPDATAAG